MRLREAGHRCQCRTAQVRAMEICRIKARAGEIILRTPLRRVVFFAGLSGAVILALLLTLLTR